MKIFINWFHYIGPKIFGTLSLMINPVFILLVMTKSSLYMGNYRYLLICFAIFDIIYTIADLLTPIGFINTPAGFATFLVDGPYSNNVRSAEHAVASHCFFISLSYAILTIHFLYRFVLLCKPQSVKKFFRPVGVLITLLYFFLQGVSWTVVCETCLAVDENVHEAFGPLFAKLYKVDSRKVGFLAAQFSNASDYIVRRSWTGIISLNILSMVCLIVNGVLGYKILTEISSARNLSRICIMMHRQLFKALVVQTSIPTFASFVPSVVIWYSPRLGFNMGWWSDYVCTVAMAAFPFFDPLAVIFFIPSYKKALPDLFT